MMPVASVELLDYNRTSVTVTSNNKRRPTTAQFLAIFLPSAAAERRNRIRRTIFMALPPQSQTGNCRDDDDERGCN